MLQKYRGWGFGVAAVTMMSLLLGTENYFALAERGMPRPWLTMVLLELPAWLVWLAASPVIYAFSRRFPITGRHRWRNLLIHIPAGAAIALACLAVVVLLKWPDIRTRVPDELSFGLILQEYRRLFSFLMMVYFGIVAIIHAAASRREAELKTLRESQLQTLVERSRRDLLRMQLHPHFLFNTLHAISALMDQDTHAARRMITRLSDLLRLSLENDAAHEVTLEEEMEFLEKYLEIQKIRFGDRLTVRYEVDPSARTLLVPRLLLQPLAENAITHGLSRLEGPGTLSVEAHRENGRLILRVLDDGPGVPAGGPKRQGVGLGNTRERLQQLYGADQRLVLENRPEGGAEVRVEIPASTVERAGATA